MVNSGVARGDDVRSSRTSRVARPHGNTPGRSIRAGNNSGKRISNWAPAIGQCEQHHAAIRGKSATIERSCDFPARNTWQVEAELIIVGHGECGSEVRRAQGGIDTHSLRKLNALRHTCQLKIQTG